MPHGSWFTQLPFYEALRGWLAALSDSIKDVVGPVLGLGGADGGKTWIDHAEIDVQHVLGALLVLGLLLVVGLIVRSSIKGTAEDLVPSDKLTVRNFCEIIVSTAFGMMSNIMGDKAARFFLPLIGTCAFFILFSNTLSLIPGFVPPTDKLNTTLAMALVIFFTTHGFGVRENGIGYFKRFLGPIISPLALPLMLLMLVIETVSHLVRPVSLSVRLMANMVADHTVLAVFLAGLATSAGAAAIWPWWVPVPALMYVMGTIVVLVQTLVFCLLSSIYIGEALEHGH